MQTNGKPTTTTERKNVFQFSQVQETAPNALVKAAQTTEAIEKKLALLERKQAYLAKQQAMKLEQAMGAVAVLKNAQPLITGVMGDPNMNLQAMVKLACERDIDIVEDCIEIEIDSEG